MMLLLSIALARPLSYEGALQAAEDANPEIAVARYEVKAAEARTMAARGVWDPMLTVSGGRNYVVNEDSFGGFETHTETTSLIWSASLGQTLPTGTSWSLESGTSSSIVFLDIVELGQEDALFAQAGGNLSLGLSQQLLEGHKLAYNLEVVRQAETARSFAEAQLRMQRQSIMLETSKAYFELVYAGAALKVAQRALDVAIEERRIVRAQVEAGNLAPVEATRVEAAVAQARLALIEAENAQASANDALAGWLGQVGETFEPTSNAPDAPSLDIDIDRAVQAALQGNPGLELARLQVEDAQLALSASRHALLPSLSLDTRLGYSGFAQFEDGTRQDSREQAQGKLTSGDFPDRYVGATFTVPLGMRAERGEVGANVAKVGSAESGMVTREQSITQQVRALVRTLSTAAQRIELAELNLQLARETLAAEKARQEAGRAVQKDVLEAQRAVSNAELELLRARTDYAKALAELQAIQGKL